MKTGKRVLVNFGEDDNLDPSPGKVIGQAFKLDMGLLIKVRHDDGQDNWHLAERVSPLIKFVDEE